MSMTYRAARQRVGRELGIILSGVATAVTGTTLIDTSSDAPFDPGDKAERLNGAGILIFVVATSTYHYRTNVTYDPATQKITWAGSVASIAAGDTYEVHLETILNPLTIWPDLFEDALKTIKRISWQEILLTGRGYYDLTDWTDIDGPEQVRRLYDVGPNILKNADLQDWPTSVTDPTDWSGTGDPSRATVLNYSHGFGLDAAAGETLAQAVSIQGPGRLRVGALAKNVNGSNDLSVTLTARLADLSTERTSTHTIASSGSTAVQRLRTELELTKRTASVLVTFTGAGSGNIAFWMPFLYFLSGGQAHRIQPTNPMLVDDVVRLYVPDPVGVGAMALLLPYATVADDGATVISSTLNDNLLIAALAVQVLRWLVSNPQLPGRGQYQLQIAIWESKFNKRHREHMRKIFKTPQLWEAHELGGGSSGHQIGRRR